MEKQPWGILLQQDTVFLTVSAWQKQAQRVFLHKGWHNTIPHYTLLWYLAHLFIRWALCTAAKLSFRKSLSGWLFLYSDTWFSSMLINKEMHWTMYLNAAQTLHFYKSIYSTNPIQIPLDWKGVFELCFRSGYASCLGQLIFLYKSPSSSFQVFF